MPQYRVAFSLFVNYFRMKSFLSQIVIAGVFVVFVSACASTSATYPDAKPLPHTFSYGGGADTTATVARVPVQEFFTDTLLRALVNEAITQNLDMKKAYQRILMTRASLRMAKGAFLPTLDAVGTIGQRRFGDYTMDGIGNYDTNFSPNLDEDQRLPVNLPDYYLGLQSRWEIDVWGKLRNAKRAAFARLLASEHGRQWITTSVVSEVASRYYELLALDNELEIVDKNILLQDRAVEVVQIQKMAGRANELGVRQMTAQLLNTRGLRARLQQEIIEVENELNYLLGRYPQPIKRGDPIMEQQLPEVIQAGIPAQMLERRPDVQAASYALIAAKADANAARAAFFPALTINASVGLQSFDPSKLFNAGSLAYSIFGGLTAPIFNRNQIRANFNIANAAGMEAFYDYQQTSIGAYRDVVNNLSRMQNYDSMARFKATEVDDLKLAVSASNDLFATGFATYLEVISAQRGVLEAELALALIRRDQFHAIIGVYRAVGGGWE